MYNVTKGGDSKYGNVIIINIEDNGEFELPFAAIQKARAIKREWLNGKKIKFLINEELYSINQLDSWAHQEYKALPKCESCAKILKDQVYTHPLCGANLFCTQACADKDHKYLVDKRDGEEEHEFDL